jgi:hypothetical protein
MTEKTRFYMTIQLVTTNRTLQTGSKTGNNRDIKKKILIVNYPNRPQGACAIPGSPRKLELLRIRLITPPSMAQGRRPEP